MIIIYLSVSENRYVIIGDGFSDSEPSFNNMVKISFCSLDSAIDHFVSICNIPLRTDYDVSFFHLSQSVLDGLGFFENKDKWKKQHDRLK